MRRCLGLDIGSDQIKLVELQKKSRGVVVVNSLAKIDTPAKAVSKGKITEHQKLKNCLGKLLNDTKTDNVVLGIASQDVMIRKASLPAMPDKEVAQALEFELPDILNISPEDLPNITYSYEILSRTSNDIHLLVVSCLRSLIEPYLEVVRSVGLVPQVIDIAAFALPRITQSDESCCYVDLGANQTTIYTEINGRFAVYRILPFGGELIDDGIAKAFGVDELEAQALKHKHDLDYLLLEGTGQKSLLRSIFQQYIGGVLQTLDYLRAQERVSLVSDVLDKVVLCGGNALLTGFDQMFQEELDIEVTHLNPFTQSNIVTEVDLPEDALVYGNAMGLGLRGLVE